MAGRSHSRPRSRSRSRSREGVREAAADGVFAWTRAPRQTSHNAQQASETFGFRTVMSAVGADTDILLTVNGKPFQVLGGGYLSPPPALPLAAYSSASRLLLLLDLSTDPRRKAKYYLLP